MDAAVLSFGAGVAILGCRMLKLTYMGRDNAMPVCLWDGCGYFFHCICWICSDSDLASISSLLASILPPSARMHCCHPASQHSNRSTQARTHTHSLTHWHIHTHPHTEDFSASLIFILDMLISTLKLESDHVGGGQMFLSDGRYCLFLVKTTTARMGEMFTE